MSKGRREIKEGAPAGRDKEVQEGDVRGSGVIPSHTALGQSVSSVLVCPGMPRGPLIPGPRLVQSKLSCLPGQEAGAEGVAASCGQLWPAVALFLGRIRLETLEFPKGQGCPGLR